MNGRDRREATTCRDGGSTQWSRACWRWTGRPPRAGGGGLGHSPRQGAGCLDEPRTVEGLAAATGDRRHTVRAALEALQAVGQASWSGLAGTWERSGTDADLDKLSTDLGVAGRNAAQAILYSGQQRSPLPWPTSEHGAGGRLNVASRRSAHGTN